MASDGYSWVNFITEKLDVELCIQLLEFIHNNEAALTSRGIFSIIQEAIVKASLDVINHVLHSGVYVVVQPLFYRAEVDWVGDHVEVIWDAQEVRIHWIVEDVATFPQTIEQPFGSFVPAIKHVSVWVRKIWPRHISHQRLVS